MFLTSTVFIVGHPTGIYLTCSIGYARFILYLVFLTSTVFIIGYHWDIFNTVFIMGYHWDICNMQHRDTLGLFCIFYSSSGFNVMTLLDNLRICKLLYQSLSRQ